MNFPLNKQQNEMGGHIVAIHQPNFFPWLGYFRKIYRANTFVFLDAVPFPRTSRGCWTNRVKLLINGQAKWVTCPVKRPGGEALIQEVPIDETQPWAGKMIKTIEYHYRKASAFSEIMPRLEGLIIHMASMMADYNMHAIESIANLIGLTTRFIKQSDLSETSIFSAKKSERLAAICKQVGGDAYLAGDGADQYEDIELYQNAGLSFYKNEFICRPYHQQGAKVFVPGLSIIDALLNVGVEGTSRLIESG